MTPQSRYVYRLAIPVQFDAGLAPGAGKDGGNVLALARDGLGRAVLRGTAIAGVLRHAWADLHGHSASPLKPDSAVARWFGYALGDGDGEGAEHRNLASPLRVADAVLSTGKAQAEQRQHNAIDRHSGAVREGGLFSLQSLPPGTAATMVIHVHVEDESDAREFCAELVGLIDSGLSFGGHGARGVGMARLDGSVRLRRFDLADLGDCAAWLDESWAWRAGGDPSGWSGEAIRPSGVDTALRVQLDLAIPRGQDICIGSGMGDEYPIEPQHVTAADGERYWRLPGSSLRGVFRAWMSRLAAREAAAGEGVGPADSVERFESRQRTPATGDEVGWLLDSAAERAGNVRALARDDRSLDEVVTCPVGDLFGSLYGAGRLHISDGISDRPVAPTRENPSDGAAQHRRHVAVDRITGGANEGFLFDHAALLPGPRFRVTLRIRDVTRHDAEWLAATLRALDIGLIRIGSSKSSGRLALASAPRVEGPDEAAAVLRAIKPSEVCNER